ncbi:DNA helicase IV [Erwinia tracheiphila]|uniref:DNA 3'-5' helicase n=1 Tax=Erwinia tracheiphila TaxID=65700 RepID=A0A345CRW3_9GAMM|nr:DNA helicase IV [Erwinia tracheiphila]AXF76180.1 DNA helicase IV [Erwinia tracheiphila]UIA85672.1 DNA helicase IV [Erwinia tracheiphila]UIA94202.1 DNA helicase IV [Erwinia tracheiphila]
MELKATSIGKHLAQHPYNRVRLLPAGVKVTGEKHEYIIPFNQLLAIRCKRGLVWGELEFTVPDKQVVRLHGTEWQETQRFFHHLNQRWQGWSEEMSIISAQVLDEQVIKIRHSEQQDKWLKYSDTVGQVESIELALSSIPLPIMRLEEFVNCREAYQFLRHRLENIDRYRRQCNEQWSQRMMEVYSDFFNTVESSPLNPSQAKAVVNGEDAVLVLAGAGSGKTSVLVARAGWLLLRKEATAEQILLLAYGRNAAEEMNDRIIGRLGTDGIEARTFHSLALSIIKEGNKKSPVISELEFDRERRYQLLINVWRQQCSEKKSCANGWRQWLKDELGWELNDNDFWQDEQLARRLVIRLERWLCVMRMYGGSQTAMIASSPDVIRDRFAKRIKLMAPIMKAWKSALKEEGTVDFSGLIHQAINIIEKGRFITPWKHILVDEYQDISPQRAALLSALRKQNKQITLFAVGDDWQAIYRFSGSEMALTTAFNHHFGEGECVMLDTTYRFNDRIGKIANSFIQKNPYQLRKTLNSLSKGNKKSVALLPENQLEALLDKISGYAELNERVLLISRYQYQRPLLLEKVQTRWPKLKIDFSTIHASKGQQADYVILLGLKSGHNGFPAVARESVIEQALLPESEDFEDAEERRLAYVAITRAKKQVWMLYDPNSPSVFVDEFKGMGVPTLRKP